MPGIPKAVAPPSGDGAPNAGAAPRDEGEPNVDAAPPAPKSHHGLESEARNATCRSQGNAPKAVAGAVAKAGEPAPPKAAAGDAAAGLAPKGAAAGPAAPAATSRAGGRVRMGSHDTGCRTQGEGGICQMGAVVPKAGAVEPNVEALPPNGEGAPNAGAAALLPPAERRSGISGGAGAQQGRGLSA